VETKKDDEMKTNTLKLAVAAMLLGVLVVPGMASADRAGINARLENQHDRIVQGNHTGEITRREDRNITVDESRVRYQEAVDRRRDGGNLTNYQRSHLDSELNRSSRLIYNDKHNDHVRVNK
jgi:hypothetical protein